MPITIDPNALYTTNELEKVLGISRQHISNLTTKGTMPPDIIAGKKHLWKGETVLRSLATPSPLGKILEKANREEGQMSKYIKVNDSNSTT